MSPQQRAELLRQAPRNSWIALSADEERMVASAGTFSQAVENAKKAGEPDPVVIYIPDEWIPVVV